MNGFRKGLDAIMNVLAGTSFLVLVVLVVWQVVSRYLLGHPSTWSEELASYLFAWTSLLGACLVTGERGHMNVDFVVRKFSPSVQAAFAIGFEIIAFLFSVIILLWGGWQISSLALGQVTASLGVAVGVFYFILPFAGVVNAVYTVLNILDILRRGLDAESDENEFVPSGEEGRS